MLALSFARAEEVPYELKGIGITEHLGAQSFRSAIFILRRHR